MSFFLFFARPDGTTGIADPDALCGAKSDAALSVIRTLPAEGIASTASDAKRFGKRLLDVPTGQRLTHESGYTFWIEEK